jgi:hypothetical protein
MEGTTITVKAALALSNWRSLISTVPDAFVPDWDCPAILLHPISQNVATSTRSTQATCYLSFVERSLDWKISSRSALERRFYFLLHLKYLICRALGSEPTSNRSLAFSCHQAIGSLIQPRRTIFLIMLSPRIFRSTDSCKPPVLSMLN